MSDNKKDIFSTTDKINILSNTNNITKLISRFEKFTTENESDEERRERLCKTVITIRVLYVLAIFTALYIASNSGVISNELFMGLSLLVLVMPDIVLFLMIIIFIVNNGDRNNNSSRNPTRWAPNYPTISSEGGATNLKYDLTSTPDVFN